MAAVGLEPERRDVSLGKTSLLPEAAPVLLFCVSEFARHRKKDPGLAEPRRFVCRAARLKFLFKSLEHPQRPFKYFLLQPK